MAYGKHRHSTFYGEKGTSWNVEIYKDGFSGTSTRIDLAGEGFEITWNGQGGTRDRVFLGSECKLNCIIRNNTDETFLYKTISLGYQKYFVRIYKGAVQDSNLWWFGWIQPAFDKIENLPFPYVSSITATDSYGFFQKQKAKFFTGETQKNQPHKIRDIFFTLIEDMNLNVLSGTNGAPIPTSFNWLRTNLNWYSSPHTFGSGDPSILYHVAKGFVSKPTTFDDDGNIEQDQEPYKYKPSDVLNGVLKSFNTVGFLAEGHYNFIQPNNFADNTSGDLTCFEYNSGLISNPSNPVTINTLLTIDQSNNVILGGSSLNYEPSFERVTVNHVGGFSNIDVGSGQDMTSEFYAGSLQSGLEGQLNLLFFAKHFEKITFSNFNFTQVPGQPAPPNSGYRVISGSFKTTATLTVRLTDGTNNRYLKQTSGSNTLSWDTSAQTITIERGYNANQNDPVNNQMAIGLVTNLDPLNNSNFSNGPCRALGVSNGKQKFFTNILFESIIEQPPITGDIFITLTCNNDYSQVFMTAGQDPIYGNLNDPTPDTETTTAENIVIIPSDNNADNDVSNGITYTASQTDNISLEQFDLGDVNLGQSVINNLYSFQYLDGSIYKVAPGFKSNNSDSHINASQLLVNEFLKLQIEPLEILQADIQSADISPLKLIKYSINDDGNFKFYSFLGGTFKAQSEILSGEWFRVNSIAQNIVTDPQIAVGPSPIGFTNPNTDVLNNNTQVGRAMLENNSYAVTNASISSGVTLSKLNFSSGIKGAIKDNQQLLLTYPDGSNPLILTANGNASKSATSIDVDAFSPNINYPAGSVISPLVFDLTNVITGGGGSTSPGGSNTQVQFNDNGSFGGSSELTFDGVALSATQLIATDTDETPSAAIALKDANNISIAGFARIGSGANAHRGQLFLKDNTSTKIQFKASGSSYINSSSAKLGIGNSSPTVELDVTGNALISGNLSITGNFLPNLTSIKILPRDFIADDGGRPLMIDDASSDRFLKSFNNHTMYASVEIPIGFKATHVNIYGNDTSAITVYEATINNKVITSKGTGNVGTQINITDVNNSAQNYLLIQVQQSNTSEVYGGLVSIAKI